ncbi:peptide chain release factor N(5)-glutamine methyltransferase [Aquabacterium lacunae]|uniref:Release factor glutamine methyltransferase n=1 Tax=Aquabacterium lacunae TaxID=2528630 RepID=A0A4Q9H2Z1_9BURK|nr:peptide chain release factor N(5)-glutamine methyltransferase [Aquabacterium lacunae]TBO30268.1 peptide chain release factor N(5)-glutamine methyltransferase [Aquabacterium lacunae]
MSAPDTVAQALNHARRLGVDRLDAQLLLGHLLGGRSRTWLMAHDTDALPPGCFEAFDALLQRRLAHEPVAYLLGHKEFFGLPLQVGPGVLVPRPDTEVLVEWALDCLPDARKGHEDHAEPPRRVLDLGTGSGAIALAIQSQRPQAQVTAVDASDVALAVARANAQALQLPVRCLLGSWFEPVAGEVFDVIVSNPPYIAEGDPHLAALVHEPISALTAGPDGLSDLRHLVAQAHQHLAPGGWLLLEHGHDQHAPVKALLEATGFQQVSGRFDLGGHVRCTGGQTRPD